MIPDADSAFHRQPRKVLITGGSGFIGSRLGLALARRGHEVLLIDRRGDSPVVGPCTTGRLRAFRGDVLELDSWCRHLTDVDVVIHAAGIHRVDEVSADPDRASDVNVEGTRGALAAAIGQGVERFVYFSTSKVYGEVGAHGARETDPLSPQDTYARTKVSGEQVCSETNERGEIETAVVRPFSVYGPGQDARTGYVGALLASAASGTPAVLSGDPTVVRDFVHVDTVVDLGVALVEVRRLEAPIWNAGSGSGTSLDELVRTFAEVTDLAGPATYRTPRSGTLYHSYADMTRARSLFDHDEPSLADGLREALHAHLR